MTQNNCPELSSKFKQLEIQFEDQIQTQIKQIEAQEYERSEHLKIKNYRAQQDAIEQAQEEEEELIGLITLQSDITPLICILQLTDIQIISTILKTQYNWPTRKILAIAKSLLTQKVIKSMLGLLRKTPHLEANNKIRQDLTKLVLVSVNQLRSKTMA